jgi:DNA-binding NarL/FixJ family response regulator
MQPSVETGVKVANVWVLEDSPEYAETVQELIDAQEGLSCSHWFRTGESLLEHLNAHFAPEAMLVDIGLPGMSGIEVVEAIHGRSPSTQMVMLTISEDNDRIFRAICAGASGYLLKTSRPKTIVDAVREALEGGAPMTPQIARRVLSLFTQYQAPRHDYSLTDREREVLAEMIDGGTKKEIGKRLFIEAHTVDTHMRNIYTKLHVHSRTEAVVKALRENLVR